MKELCVQVLDLQALAVKRFDEESVEQVGEQWLEVQLYLRLHTSVKKHDPKFYTNFETQCQLVE